MLGIETRSLLFPVVGILLGGLLLGSCSDGKDGLPGASSALVSGTVVNATTGAPLAGVTVATDPVVPGVTLVTDTSGSYGGELPIGPYSLSCDVTNYESASGAISVVADVPVVKDFALEPVAPVVLSVTPAPAGVGPGDTFDLTVTATPMDDSVVTSYLWSQSASAQATITNPGTASPTITLGSEAAYKAELLLHLDVQDRWIVQGVNPLALEEAGHAAFTVDVTTTSGTYTATVDVGAVLDFATVNPGLLAVPRGKVVFLNGKDQATYDWALAARPTGSTATLSDATGRNPWFLPDVSGTYTLTVTDLTGTAPAVVTLDVEAGTWIGGITSQDGNGRPEMFCAACHSDKVNEWKETGHAEILTDNLNTSGYYRDSCFVCHSVGFDPAVDNGGFDDATDYAAFYADLFAAGHNSPDPGNWAYMLVQYPTAAQKANIQCENCHGPNGTPLHQDGSVSEEERIGLSSDVCAVCHGEPPRHARFQQWEESGHANYELAIDEGTRGSCAKCHTVNGFLAWLPILESGDDGPDGTSPAVTWTEEQIHPQTCVTCHDPHDAGTTTGVGTDAPVRIQGDTFELMSGFAAYAVGKGAVCMQCHNARRGLRNDDTWDATKGDDPDRAPHGGPQTDLLMGRNAYFVDIGFRGPHGFISNTCVTCHLELTDPPADLSYNLGGTNHTFAASDTICADCHGSFTAENVKAAVDLTLAALDQALVEAIRLEIGRQIDAGNDVDLTGFTDPADSGSGMTVTITDVAAVENIVIAEYHGRQAANFTVGGQVLYSVQLNGDTEVYPSGGSPAGTGLLESPGGEVIARAGWNYWLVSSDGSHGIHNASFAGTVLEAAITALDNEFG